MTKKEEKELIESLHGDDSILVDPGVIFEEGATEFFTNLMQVLPKLKKTSLILPLAAIERLNNKISRAKSEEYISSLQKIVDWVQIAVDYSDMPNSQVIIVGDAEGAFADKTILNQVSFLLPNHNVLLITESEAMTKKARDLRDPAIQNDHKLHCCKIKPDGTLGLYYFYNEKVNLD